MNKVRIGASTVASWLAAGWIVMSAQQGNISVAEAAPWVAALLGLNNALRSWQSAR